MSSEKKMHKTTLCKLMAKQKRLLLIKVTHEDHKNPLYRLWLEDRVKRDVIRDEMFFTAEPAKAAFLHEANGLMERVE